MLKNVFGVPFNIETGLKWKVNEKDSLHSLKIANYFKFPKTWIWNIKSFWRLILISEKMTHFTQFEFKFLSIHIWCFFHYLIIILSLIHNTSLHLAVPLILSSLGSIFFLFQHLDQCKWATLSKELLVAA